ncbi:MAG: hypothetical protein JKX68_12815 [Flavobacteriales bacterium]|nr:hypothetical protein [Flavobacteriales bacterium]
MFTASTELVNHIENLKSKLYEVVDQLPKEVADTISLNGVIYKDNYDAPTWIMGLGDPNNPVKNLGEEIYSAITLREKIESYNSLINKIGTEVTMINIDGSYNFEGVLEPWEVSTFYHAPLAFVVLSLNRIQLEANIICNTILTNNLLEENITSPKDTIN